MSGRGDEEKPSLFRGPTLGILAEPHGPGFPVPEARHAEDLDAAHQSSIRTPATFPADG